MNDPRESACTDPHFCITCSDAATEMRIVSIDNGIARCSDARGDLHDVLIGLVGDAAPGARLLVHAGAALTIDRESAP